MSGTGKHRTLAQLLRKGPVGLTEVKWLVGDAGLLEASLMGCTVVASIDPDPTWDGDVAHPRAGVAWCLPPPWNTWPCQEREIDPGHALALHVTMPNGAVWWLVFLYLSAGSHTAILEKVYMDHAVYSSTPTPPRKIHALPSNPSERRGGVHD